MTMLISTGLQNQLTKYPKDQVKLLKIALTEFFEAFQCLVTEPVTIGTRTCSCGNTVIFMELESEHDDDMELYICTDCIHDLQYNTRQEAAELETQKKLNDQFYSDFKNARR